MSSSNPNPLPYSLLLLLLAVVADIPCVFAWGTQPSNLVHKCESLSCTSFFDHQTDTCYVVTTKRVSKKNVDDSLCRHIQGFNGALAKKTKKLTEILTKNQVLNEEQQTLYFQGGQSVGNGKINGAVCEYTDDFSCDDGYELFGVYCFKMITKAKTFAEAQRSCRSEQGALAVVHTDELAQKLAVLAKGCDIKDYFYIGTSSPKGQQQFVNVDSTPTDYFRFVPRDDGLLDTTARVLQNFKEPALALSSRVTNDDGIGTFGYMDAFESSTKLPFVCQSVAYHCFNDVVVPYSKLSF